MVLIIVFFIVVGIALLYVLSTMCRSGHPELTRLQGWRYGHRGLYGPGAPENSMEAFRRAKEAGYGVELDIHLLKDGNLGVIHDSLLIRTTGADRRIEDLTTDQLKDFFLEGTEETIPHFQQVLDLFAGKVPLIIELKCVDNNYAKLCETACKMLDGYNGVYCMESFDPRCIYWLRKHRPDIIRGQLTENYFASKSSKLPWFLKFVLKNQMLNFLIKPDFVAYKFRDRKTFSNILCRKLWRVQGVTWTIKNRQELDAAVAEGWIPIFEGFEP